MTMSKLKSKHKLFMKICILIICLWIALTYTILRGYYEKRERYLTYELDNFNFRVEATLKTYEVFSNYIFKEIIDKPEILEIMKKANKATDSQKDLLRKELYDLLEEKYEHIQEYNFRQLHFHLPNCESFLRLHAPEEFGDDLTNIRDSVRIVNEEKKYLFGFEEGRIYNGYRFVYPLSYQGEHIGSVEVSVSLKTLVGLFQQLYPDKDLFFIMEKDIVEEKIFKSYLNNYTESSFSSKYYYDKEVEATSQKYANVLKDEERKEFFSELELKIDEKLSKKEKFSTIYRFNDQDLYIGFVAIENILNKPVGYLISMSKDVEYKNLHKDMYIELVLVSVISILFISFSYYFIKSREKIEKISYYDSLTKIYNRYKFLEFTSLEMERFKRSGSVFSVIMFDIDFFKKVNDTYGHNKGDYVLKTLASVISKKLRAIDVFARWGGEEFIVLLPETNKDDANIVAEKIRKLIEKYEFKDIENITISLGVSQMEDGITSIEEVIDRADKALYHSKNNGRNKTTVYTKI